MDINYSSSPERGSFYRNCIKKQFEEGKISQEIYDGTMTILDEEVEREKQRDKEFNLEYNLRSNEEILAKARNSEIYCQDLYAALCNNRFFYGDKEWTCSWRHAGGIIADMIEKGDYINWYCSGNEGHVTEEIRTDLIKLGWIVKPYDRS